MSEVRFDLMVPSQIRARREACNLAYLPVGSLEWHGPHMPFGTDYLTVTHIAQEAARRFGGVVFPPIYYGDVRYYLQECREEWQRSYAEEMAISRDFGGAFPYRPSEAECCPAQPDDGEPAEEPLPFTLEEQERFFSLLIAKSLLEVHLYGFRNVIVMPGHGPNPAYCERGIEIYRQNVARRKAFGPPANAASWFYLLAAYEFEPWLTKFWIHADKWEGSVTMVAAPETVHPEELPPAGEVVPAYLGHPYIHEDTGRNPDCAELFEGFDALDPRNDMNAEYGRAQVEGVLTRFREFIQGFLSPPA